jgi:glycosyltransferase involved in cell wall biosynthesis
MKKILIICVCALLLLLCACGNTQTEKEVTVPENTEAAVNTEPTAAATENPFEFESEIDFSDFETEHLDSEKINGIRSGLQLPEDAHIVVFVGRIAKEKCIEMPIEAMSMVKDPRIHLVVVGGGIGGFVYGGELVLSGRYLIMLGLGIDAQAPQLLV